MTTPWHDQLLVRVDDEYDQENADDGVSRFGAYLRQRPNEFRDGDGDEPEPIEDPVEFVLAAWRVATSPVMAPGYVRVRPDLHGVELHRDYDNDGSLYADVRVPLRHGHIGSGPKRFPYSWQDWDSDRDYGGEGYAGLLEPRENKRPSVLASLVVRVPGRDWAGLVTPTAYKGRTLLDEARQTLAALVENVNTDAGPIVARMLA